ncbi:IS5 family transposase [Hymenobacter elongatus]|nr:IS5 family transposase [Hymenobacter elongatus]
MSDRAWALLAPHLAGKAGDVGRTAGDNRLFLNAVLWIARHGAAWRALPARFGKADTQRKRCRRWAQTGVWQRLFEAVQEPDLDWVMLDSTVVRAHAQAAGSQKKAASAEALGRSRGGLTTKIHALVDALGNPLRLLLGPGQQADCQRAAELLAAAPGAGHVLADKGYDTDAVVANAEALGARVVIPSKKNRRVERVIDRNLYRDRNKVERFFSRLKQFRRLATRYDKTASSFLGMLHFVSALLWLR